MIATTVPPMAHRIKIPRPWVPAANTDLHATFKRIRQEQAMEALRQFSGGGYVENRTRST